MANEILLACLAFAAIYIVVQSGEKKVEKVKTKRVAAQAKGKSKAQAKVDNPTEQEENERQLVVQDMSKAITEFQFLANYERNNDGEMNAIHQFPYPIWARIVALQKMLQALGKRSQPVFLRSALGGQDKLFWSDYDKLWQGTLRFGEREKTLRATIIPVPVEAKIDEAPNIGVDDKVETARSMELIEFNAAPPSVPVQQVDVELFKQMIQFAFNAGRTQATEIHKHIHLPSIEGGKPQETTNANNSAFNTLPRIGPKPPAEANADKDTRDGLGGTKAATGKAPTVLALDAAPGKPVPGGAYGHKAREDDPTKTGSRKRGAEDMEDDGFDAAPNKVASPDEAPAPPPKKPRKNEQQIALIPPIPSDNIQSSFNASNEAGIGVQNKPSTKKEAFRRGKSAKQAEVDLKIKIDLDQYITQLEKLQAKFMKGIREENKTELAHDQAKAAFNVIKYLLPPGYKNPLTFAGIDYKDDRTRANFSRTLVLSIEATDAYKEWYSVNQPVQLAYKEWKRKRAAAEALVSGRGKKRRIVGGDV